MSALPLNRWTSALAMILHPRWACLWQTGRILGKPSPFRHRRGECASDATESSPAKRLGVYKGDHLH